MIRNINHIDSNGFFKCHIDAKCILNNESIKWNGLHLSKYIYGRKIEENYRPSLPYHQLVYFKSGALSGQYSYGNSNIQPYHANSGSWYFGQAFQNNSFWNWQSVSSDEISSLNIHIEPHALNMVANKLYGLNTAFVQLPHLTGIEDPFLTQTVFALEEDLQMGCPIGGIYGESIAIAIYTHLIKKYTNINKNTSSICKINESRKSHIKKSVDYIHGFFNRDITLSELADVSCTSKFYFSKLFKHYTGTSPYQYIISVRLNEAEKMLTCTRKPIGNISIQCGFKTESNFYRFFKKKFGKTPNQYRL